MSNLVFAYFADLAEKGLHQVGEACGYNHCLGLKRVPQVKLLEGDHLVHLMGPNVEDHHAAMADLMADLEEALVQEA